MQKILQEPLFHFILIGIGIFLLYEWTDAGDRGEEKRILITTGDVDRLVRAYEKNWGQGPDSSTVKKLVEQHIHSEIYYQEALNLGLEHNDEIIKRRLRQKYEFLVKDLSEQRLATEEELRAFYEKNRDAYMEPLKMSFHQLYFSPDKRKNPAKDAQKIFEKVLGKEVAHAKGMGDDFHLQTYYGNRSYRDLVQNFGKVFSDSLFAKTSLGWQKPIPSGYGHHLIYISEIEAAKPLAFEDVLTRLEDDWKRQQLAEFNEDLIQSLRSQYTVVHKHGYFEE